MEDCIFCKIVKGELPSKKVYEDEYLYAFYDIDPVAKIHVLVIPKVHIASLNDVNEENIHIISHIMHKIKDIAKMLGIYESGYKVVTNIGKDGGQMVKHLHFHILGGEDLNGKFARL